MAQAAAWLGVPPDHLFGLAALPYGSYTAAHHAEQYRVGVAIGDCVLDLGRRDESSGDRHRRRGLARGPRHLLDLGGCRVLATAPDL